MSNSVDLQFDRAEFAEAAAPTECAFRTVEVARAARACRRAAVEIEGPAGRARRKASCSCFGLTKASTLLSMLLSFGVYWTQWGGWFAFGVVLSIYVHEMGHVAALRRFGIAASAPMFVPGFGALVRLQQAPPNRREDARIGLAGPIWGAAAAVAAFAIGHASGRGLWLAIAHTAAWINLFNLLPVWQLDGSRGFASMTKAHRAAATTALAAAWFLSGDGLFILLAVVAGVRTVGNDAPDEADSTMLGTYVGLVAVLTLLVVLSTVVTIAPGEHHAAPSYR